jgi:hypothetical protein
VIAAMNEPPSHYLILLAFVIIAAFLLGFVAGVVSANLGELAVEL